MKVLFVSLLLNSGLKTECILEFYFYQYAFVFPTNY